MNKIFYFLMVFFAFSAVQVGAQQDGKGTADAPGFKVDGANMTGELYVPRVVATVQEGQQNREI